MTTLTVRAATETGGVLTAWRRAWVGLRLRDALLISLVPLVVVTWLVLASLAAYRRARGFDDWYARSVSVAGAFSGRLRSLVALPAVTALRQRFDVRAADPTVIRIALDGAAWDSLASLDLPDWSVWHDATLTYGGTDIPVRVRKRGDTSVHWLTEKHSMSVRTPRDRFYKRFRSFGLSSKDVLASFVANRMAHDFGLLATATEVVPVFVNNRFYGIFRFIEPVDETFLRRVDRMPGNVYRGDRAERGEWMKGQQRNLFLNPYLWDRPAVSERWTAAGAGQVRLLVGDLAGTIFEDALRVMRRFDRDELARFVAYLLAAGDPYHIDDLHNQFLYEDPSTQLLHPIPWDTRLLPLDGPAFPLHTLMQAWLRDPFLLEAVTRQLGDAVPDRVRGTVDSLLDATMARHGEYFRYDRLRAGVIDDVGTPDAVRAVVSRNMVVLESWLHDDTVAVGVTRHGSEAVLDLETRGRVGVDLVALDVGRASGVRVWRDLDGDGIRGAGDTEVPVRARGGRVVLRDSLPLYAGWTTTNGVEPGHIPYRFFVTGLAPDARVSVELRNRVRGGAAAVASWPTGEAIRPATAWHPWRYPRPTATAHRYAGTVRILDTLRIPPGDTLILAPGTTLLLGSEASVISQGRLLARGTPARPIRIRRDDPARAWGTFALLGPGADSSVLRWAEIAGGGGAVVDRIEFIGMVNVHRAHGVVIEHVTFRDNVRSDDTFHALHATVAIRDSRFLRANGDAIDFDISGGEITGTIIEHSVNDGIDLMTSAPWIADNVITGSGDKGISIGEASRPVIFNNLIARCLRGLEPKDRSQPLVLNTDLLDNGIGVHGRRKNWRYGGGPWSTIVLTGIRGEAIANDPFSRLTPWGTPGVDRMEERDVPVPGDIRWLYDGLGVRPDSVRVGRVSSWRRVTPVRPVDSARFEDDFASLRDGWVPSGGTTRLEKRDGALVLEMERRPGIAARRVAWDLPHGGTLVLEVAGRDMTEGTVTATGDAGPVTATFTVASDPDVFRWVTVRLPPGRYAALRLSATPRPGLSHTVQRATGLAVLRAGRLFLRGYTVMPDPAPGEAR